MLANILQIIGVLLQYWICLAQFVFAKKAYSECVLFPQDKHARVQIFSLALIFRLWAEPHYRSASFQQDVLDNLKNVAVPGTGVALSWFCHSKLTAMFFVFLLNPLICFLGAINQAQHSRTTDSIHELIHLIDVHFTRNLLHPDDWFSLWRMNCRLVSYHSLVTGSTDYKMEDKWTFLVAGKALNVPVSPYDDTTEALVCKNKLIEGGMGIHFYRNAAFGGDWILQERLQNAAWLNALLPANAPLSTMRVITTSSFTLSEDMDEALQIVTRAHYAMMPEVPIVGWDVAFTTKGIFLLEVNLSCNFFRGSFDLPRYIDLIDRYWLQLEKMARLNADFKKNHQCKASSSSAASAAVHTSWDNLSLDNVTANASMVGSSSNGTLMTMALMQDLLTTETVLEGAFERSHSDDDHGESPDDIDHGHEGDGHTPVLPQNPAQTIKYKRHSFRRDAAPHAAST
eukprot:gene995-718_t